MTFAEPIRRRGFSSFSRGWRGLVIVISCAALCGCGGHPVAGALRTQSLGEQPVVLKGNYRVAVFTAEDEHGASFMLSDSPLDEVLEGRVETGQMLHIELLWLPKAGATPMDSTATNATVRHVVISRGEVGVYGGAGFVMPTSSLGGDSIQITLRDASLQLMDSTPGFVDLLTPAHMTGTITAKRDDQATRRLNQAVSQLVTNALGKTRYVVWDKVESRKSKIES